MRVNHTALRTIRERSLMSQSALAAAAGIGQPHLSLIEAGKRQADDEVIVALAKALKVELPAIILDPHEPAQVAAS